MRPCKGSGIYLGTGGMWGNPNAATSIQAAAIAPMIAIPVRIRIEGLIQMRNRRIGFRLVRRDAKCVRSAGA